MENRDLMSYLADYVQQEFEDNFRYTGGSPTTDDWRAWLSAGIEAFESTENVKIKIESEK